MTAEACCVFLHRLGIIFPQPVDAAGLMARLIHRGAASLAQAALVAMQAGGDRADIGDFTGAEAVDVRRAGPSLLGRADRERRGGRDQAQSEPEGSAKAA